MRFSQLAFAISVARNKTYRWRGHVREVGADAGSVDHIVEGELVDKRTDLQQKGQWLFNSQFWSLLFVSDLVYLANATGSSCNN